MIFNYLAKAMAVTTVMLTCPILYVQAEDTDRAIYPQHLLWGDTHVHSSYSMDAGMMGNTRLAPDVAFRFARGEEVESTTGQKARLKRPLDFLVVADHAEYMGLLPRLRAGDKTLLADTVGQRIVAAMSSGDAEKARLVGAELIDSLAENKPLFDNTIFKQSVWDEITRFADQYNQPGVFTAFIGFEWSSMPRGDNLHRVVMYRDGAARASQLIPVSTFDGDRPEDLWTFMERYTQHTGGQVLAIPHNANTSNGRMFSMQDGNGAAIDTAYAKRRARWEPVVEVTQIKGDAETHPLLSPDDEFSDFETWDKGNLRVGGTTPKQTSMLKYEYARSALKLGLDVTAKTGANPFQFGMIGSTDAHTSLATAAEDNFWGKASFGEKGLPRVKGVFMKSTGGDEYDVMTWQQAASGYAAAWATGNTRAEVFDAFKRREVYATTGSRIVLRFFAGDYTANDIHRPDWVSIGYNQGVPMGAMMSARNETPAFIVAAAKDIDGANLDRIQIVKGWRTKRGELREKVYTVATSDNRRISVDSPVEPLESTVSSAKYLNTIGAPQLSAYWQDPDFNSEQHAFYYARVLEIVTPRWTAYDEEEIGEKLPEEIPKTLQERAYSSPIWYRPKS